MSKWDQSKRIPVISFGYPVNDSSPNCISATSLYGKVIVAYGSGEKIVILRGDFRSPCFLSSNCGYITCLCFERIGFGIVACDNKGNCMIWQFRENNWFIMDVFCFGSISKCVSWVSSKKIIALSTEKGLGIINYSSSLFKYDLPIRNSIYCSLNGNGTCVLSHNNDRILSIINVDTMDSILLKHPYPIVFCDFHSFLPIFLTITNNGILRLWDLTISGQYNQLFSTKCSFNARFVMNISYNFELYDSTESSFAYFSTSGNLNQYFMDEKGTKTKEKDFLFTKTNGEFLVGCFSSLDHNELVFLNKNSIDLHRSQVVQKFSFHKSKIKQGGFFGKRAYTLDESGVLIFWSWRIEDPQSIIVSYSAKTATLDNLDTIVFLEGDQIKSFSIDTKTVSHPIIRINGILLRHVYVNNTFFLFYDGMVKWEDKSLPFTTTIFDISPLFQNSFIIVGSDGQDISIYLLPLQKRVGCQRAVSKISNISVVSINQFFVQTPSSIEHWYCYKDCFVMVGEILITNHLRFLYDSCLFGGRILLYSDKEIMFWNSDLKSMEFNEKISNIYYNNEGDLMIVFKDYVEVYPLSVFDLSSYNNGQKDFPSIQQIEFFKSIVSPYLYLYQATSNQQTIFTTFQSLLYFRGSNQWSRNKSDIYPIHPNCFFEGENMSNLPLEYLEIHNYFTTIDIYGLRFLYSIYKTKIPPSQICLYFMFSSSQKLITDEILSEINISRFLDYCFPLTITSQDLFISLVKISLSNSWKQFHDVDALILYYASMNMNKTIAALYDSLGDSQRATFFKNDFSQDKWKQKALKNAYSALSHHKYEVSSALYLIAGDFSSAFSIISGYLQNPITLFLVLRLVYGSLSDPSFLKCSGNINWIDDFHPVMVSLLLNPNNGVEGLKKYILEKPNRSSIFGDLSIGLFQIYEYISGSIAISNELSFKLLTEGCAPLANFLQDYAEKTHSHNDKVIPKSNSDDDVFGYTMNISDEYEEEFEIINNTEFDIFQRFFMLQIEFFSGFYECYNKDHFIFSYHFGGLSFCFNNSPKEYRSILLTTISEMLDYFSFNSVRSLHLFLEPNTQISLTTMIHKMYMFQQINFDCPFLLSTHYVIQNSENDSVLSVLFSLLVLSLFLRDRHLLLCVLGIQDKNLKNIEIGNSHQSSCFDITKASDSYPFLHMQLVPSESSSHYYVDRSRIIFIIIILRSFLSIYNEINTNKFKKMKDILYDLLKSFQDSLINIQIECDCEPFEIIPNYVGKTEFESWFCQRMKDDLGFFDSLNRQSMKKMYSSTVIRNGKFYLDSSIHTMEFQFQIYGIYSSILPNNNFIVHSDEGLFYFKNSFEKIRGFQQNEYDQIRFIVPHPSFDLFISVYNCSIKLFDQNQRVVTDFRISYDEKISHVKFSPNGTRIVVCSSHIFVFALDITKSIHESVFCKKLIHQIQCIEWMNENSKLVFSFVDSKALSVYNTLSNTVSSIEYPKLNGNIDTIIFDNINNVVLITTVIGEILACDPLNGFLPYYSFITDTTILSIQWWKTTMILVLSDKTLIGFSSRDPMHRDKLSLPCQVKNLCIIHDSLVFTSNDSNELFIIHTK